MAESLSRFRKSEVAIRLLSGSSLTLSQLVPYYVVWHWICSDVSDDLLLETSTLTVKGLMRAAIAQTFVAGPVWSGPRRICSADGYSHSRSRSLSTDRWTVSCEWHDCGVEQSDGASPRQQWRATVEWWRPTARRWESRAGEWSRRRRREWSWQRQRWERE
jgi:hypothetical protein